MHYLQIISRFVSLTIGVYCVGAWGAGGCSQYFILLRRVFYFAKLAYVNEMIGTAQLIIR